MTAQRFRKRKSLCVGERTTLSAYTNSERDVVRIISTLFGVTNSISLLVPEARALRDWLDKVVPKEKP